MRTSNFALQTIFISSNGKATCSSVEAAAVKPAVSIFSVAPLGGVMILVLALVYRSYVGILVLTKNLLDAVWYWYG